MNRILFILYILITPSLSAQVEITSKTIQSSFRNTTDCSGYSYTATIPVFLDTTSCFSALQDSIVQLYSKAYLEEGLISVTPDFTNLLMDNYNCLPMEYTNLEFKILSNTKTTLSFYISSEWGAGGGGNGGGTDIYTFNLDLKKCKEITLHTLFKERNIDRVLKLFDQKIQKEMGPVDPTDPYAPRYTSFGITDSTLQIVYRYLPNGSKQYHGFIHIPWTDLNKYLIRKRE